MGTSGSYQPPSVPSALLAAWNYSGATATITDLSGNGQDFVLTGTSGRVAGYTYGGTQPGVQGIRQASAETQEGPVAMGLQSDLMTVMTWAITGPVDPSWFLELHRDPTDNTGVLGWLMLGGAMTGRAKKVGDVAYNIAVPTDSPNWHHHALTHDGTTLRAYRDGVLVGTQAMGAPVWAADRLMVFNGSGPGVTLSETRFFNQALSAAEIATWMNTPVV